jgi:hypothetical protein
MVDINKANADVIRQADIKESEIRQEKWLPIDYLKGYYDISNMGRVRSLHVRYGVLRKIPLVMRMVSTGDNMGTVTPSVNNIRYRVNIGKEVWRAFVGEIPEGCHVGRVDKNRFNNRLSNLIIEDSTEIKNRQDMSRKRCSKIGVGRHNGKYRLRISLGGKNRHIGVYDSECEANAEMDRVKHKIENDMPLFDSVQGETWEPCDSRIEASNMGRIRKIIDKDNGLYKLILSDSFKSADGTVFTRAMAVWDAHGVDSRLGMDVWRKDASKGYDISNLEIRPKTR